MESKVDEDVWRTLHEALARARAPHESAMRTVHAELARMRDEVQRQQCRPTKRRDARNSHERYLEAAKDLIAMGMGVVREPTRPNERRHGGEGIGI